jgi:hypothetical protein
MSSGFELYRFVIFAAAAARRKRRLQRVSCVSLVLAVDGLPLLKPPYGVLSAINLDRGEIVWQVPHGDTPDIVRNHPALKGLSIPKTGQVATGGVGLMVTMTLVVMGDPQVTTTPNRAAGTSTATAASNSL